VSRPAACGRRRSLKFRLGWRTARIGAIARVFVTRRLAGTALERLQAAHQVEVWPEPQPPTPEQLAERLSDADGLLCMLTDRIDAALLDRCPRLRAIANYAVGTDNIDLAAAAARGIQVGVTPDVLTDATADLAFALLLAAARNIVSAAAAARSGAWRTWEPAGWIGADVAGATLGIVGYGRIGQAVASRARGFDMEVLHTRETPLGELLERSDFVSLHAPLTDETRHLIDADALKRMKASAILVNTARGALVDQQALLAALDAGEIGAAALDVTDPEPPPPGDPILAHEKVLVVPHIGSATHTTREKMTEIAVENLLAALAGEPMPHPAGARA
jgi:glyoxylate reductase